MSDALIHTSTCERHPTVPIRAIAWIFALCGGLHAAQLTPETVKAWDEYIEAAHARAEPRREPGAQFWFEEDAGRLERVRHAEILAAPVVGHGTRRVPGGLIHHWIGAVFVPNTTLPELFAVLRDYDRYKEIYRPATVEARLILREENSDKFAVLLSKGVLFVTTTSYGEYESHYTRTSEKNWSSVGYSTRLQDVADYGKPTEHKLEPGDGSGFLWRAYSLSRYRERDGGVYMELEGIVLTRDIPVFWRWLVNPIVDKLSKGTILTSLGETRNAVHRSAADGTVKEP